MSIPRTVFFPIVLAVIIFGGCKKESSITLKEPVLNMEFVQISKGSFQMGETKIDSDSNSKPVHQVTISKDFWLGRTEVTQNQWQQIMGNEEIHPEKPSPFRDVNPDYPVVGVSYFDVEKFLKRLNEQSTNYRFRLPTEAEWEYACRAGTTTPFANGPRLDDSLANFNAEVSSEYSSLGAFLEHPISVGSYTPNQWGLYDMHGNVWEWVSDWHAPYSENAITDPKGPSSGKEKILRGGSWYFGAENARSSHRRTHDPTLWGFSIGFRVVLEKKN